MAVKVDWTEAIKPLLKKYRRVKHPLEYKNIYQLLVMVILSARDSDKNINNLAPALFKAYPGMKALSKAKERQLYPFIGKVRNFAHKAAWLIEIAQTLKTDANIPLTHEGLVELKGIGSKSANVILREAGMKPEGIIVDLHVVRVAPRLGMVTSSDPGKIEKELMSILPQKQWDAGMAMSFHGRDICRPKPLCELCLMKPVCRYYKTVIRPGSPRLKSGGG